MANREQMVVVVATAAHEDWRKQYRATNGDKPRIKMMRSDGNRSTDSTGVSDERRRPPDPY